MIESCFGNHLNVQHATDYMGTYLMYLWAINVIVIIDYSHALMSSEGVCLCRFRCAYMFVSIYSGERCPEVDFCSHRLSQHPQRRPGKNSSTEKCSAVAMRGVFKFQFYPSPLPLSEDSALQKTQRGNWRRPKHLGHEQLSELHSVVPQIIEEKTKNGREV